jgi:hypothetical protein
MDGGVGKRVGRCADVRWSDFAAPEQTAARLFPSVTSPTRRRQADKEETMRARMRQACLLAMVTVAVVITYAGTALAQASSPTNIGTWKLNPAKSVFSGGIAPRNSTFKVEVAGAGVKITFDDLTANGKVRHWYYIANYDGKDSPIVGDSSFNDVTVALTRVDADTTIGIFKKGRTAKYTETSAVSNDGRTMTISTTVPDALEMTYNSAALSRPSASVGHGPISVAVYDKQ